MSDAAAAAPAGPVEEAAPSEAVPAVEKTAPEEEGAAGEAPAAPPLAAPTDAVEEPTLPAPPPPPAPAPPAPVAARPPPAQPSAGGVYGRSLTEQEQHLIAQRVREQQAAFRAWEEREAKRKVRMPQQAFEFAFFLRPRPLDLSRPRPPSSDSKKNLKNLNQKNLS